MTKLQKYRNAASVAVIMLTGPAFAAGQSGQQDDIITLNQSAGITTEQRLDRQGDAIGKLIDWFTGMQEEIEALKAKLASKPADPAPAVLAPAPAAEVAKPAVRAVPAAPAAPATPKPPTPDDEAGGEAPKADAAKTASDAPAAPAARPAVTMKPGAIGRVGISAKGQPDVDFGKFELSTQGEIRAGDLARMAKLLPSLQRGQLVKFGFDGFMKVGDAGTYTFVLTADGTAYSRSQNCAPSLVIDGQEIVQGDAKMYMPGRGGSERDNQATYAVAAEFDGVGTLPLALRLSCTGAPVPLKLLVKGPKDAAPAVAETLYRPAS